MPDSGHQCVVVRHAAKVQQVLYETEEDDEEEEEGMKHGRYSPRPGQSICSSRLRLKYDKGLLAASPIHRDHMGYTALIDPRWLHMSSENASRIPFSKAGQLFWLKDKQTFMC